MIPTVARSGVNGQQGFDCNTTVFASQARTMYYAGFSFAARYLPRVTARSTDLSANEVQTLVQAGLGIFGVQHFEGDGWTPTREKGIMYGETAANHATLCGLAKGTSVTLDLESVDTDTPDSVIIAYCKEWHHAVLAAGFKPMLYVGWECGLTPKQLYYELPFDRYWSAYNLNTDQYPLVRGVCMKQRSGRPPKGVDFPIDINIITGDSQGGYPVLTVADVQLTLPVK